MPGMHFDGVGNGAGDFISGRTSGQKFDVLGPWQSDECAHSRFGAGIEKPAGRTMINANNVKSRLANLGQVARGLSSRPEVIARRVRFEWAIGDALDEEFLIAFEEKFCDSADWLRRSGAHSGSFLDHPLG